MSERAARRRLRLAMDEPRRTYWKACERSHYVPSALLDAATVSELNDLRAEVDRVEQAWRDSEWVPFRSGTRVEGTDESGKPLSGIVQNIYTAGVDMKGEVMQMVRTKDGTRWAYKRHLRATQDENSGA